MNEWIASLGIGGYGLAVLSALYALLPKKGSLENQRIDQLQEDLKAMREELTTQRGQYGEQTQRIDRLEDMLIWYRRRDVAWDRYVSQIKTMVERMEAPPWPAMEGILQEARHD